MCLGEWGGGRFQKTDFLPGTQVWKHKHKRKEMKIAFRRLNRDTSVLTTSAELSEKRRKLF